MAEKPIRNALMDTSKSESVRQNENLERDTSVHKDDPNWALTTARFNLHDKDVKDLKTKKPGPFYFIITRLIDIIISGIAILVFLPVMIVVAIAIRLDSPGPVIFKQLRSGLFNKPFMIYKFRSMRPKADEMKKNLMSMNEMDGPVFKIKEDPRVTKVGAFIRKWSLDELPQLFNILKGDMAIVGPRPLPVEEVAQLDDNQMARQSARPGLTCIWQISGRNDIPFEEWIQLDLIYIKNRGFLLDMEIFFRTFGAVLKRSGSS